MFKILLVAAALGLAGSTVAVAQAAPSAAPAAAPVTGWQEGVKAGTLKFSAAPGATCRPLVGTLASDKRCKVTFSGKFTATDRGYKGTYSGTATVVYTEPGATAGFDSGSITYVVRNMRGVLLDTVTLSIDLGTGGITGYPYDLTLSYWIEERTDVEPGIVLRANGWAINQLDANLNPTHTFIDRYAFY